MVNLSVTDVLKALLQALPEPVSENAGNRHVSGLAGLIVLQFLLLMPAALAQTTAAGIPLDTPWKQQIHDFATENLQHSAWGLTHAERNYLLALELAESEDMVVDEDVLFAASFLHDMGALPAFAVQGADHAETSAEQAETVLREAGFPMDKLDQVQSAIRTHMYYADFPAPAEAQLLHEADTLDFLGSIGIARILSLTGGHPWASDMAQAVSTLEGFHRDLPPTLRTDAARRIGERRVEEGRRFLESLKSASVDGAAL